MAAMLAARADVPKYTRRSVRATEKVNWKREYEVTRYLTR